MGWPLEIVMVRHGESRSNVLDRDARAACEIPSHDMPLTERGRKQAEITAKYLRSVYPEGFGAVYASYFKRSVETAKILTPKARIREDSLLAEANRGVWASMIPSLVHQHMPWEAARSEKEGLYHYRPIGGESMPDVEQRIELFKNKLRNGPSVVLVNMHNYWHMLFQKRCFGHSVEWAIEEYKKAPTVENASITVYGESRDGTRLELKCETVVPWKSVLD